MIVHIVGDIVDCVSSREVAQSAAEPGKLLPICHCAGPDCQFCIGVKKCSYFIEPNKSYSHTQYQKADKSHVISLDSKISDYNAEYSQYRRGTIQHYYCRYGNSKPYPTPLMQKKKGAYGSNIHRRVRGVPQEPGGCRVAVTELPNTEAL